MNSPIFAVIVVVPIFLHVIFPSLSIVAISVLLELHSISYFSVAFDGSIFMLCADIVLPSYAVSVLLLNDIPVINISFMSKKLLQCCHLHRKKYGYNTR